jgi:transcription termination factor NusB
MKNEMLIQLYQQKDRMRKRVLYELFKSEIEMKASLPFIVKMINEQLGIENLISIADITYCRFFFKTIKVNKPQNPKNKPIQQSLLLNNKADSQNFEIKFTDLDLEPNISKSIKSKFSQ